MSQKNSFGGGEFSATFVFLAAAFCVCLTVSNIFVPRLWQVGRLPLQLSGAVVLFPISYILNDCLTEVYGYRKASFVIWTGFAMATFSALMCQIVSVLPDPMYEDSISTAHNFNSLFSQVPRCTLGSLLAFVAGSNVNAWIMSLMKVKDGGRRFCLRAVLSSVAGELCDSLIFLPVAFAGILPFTTLMGLMCTQVVTKTLYEIIILPVTSWFVKKLKFREGIDTFDDGISYNPFQPLFHTH